MQNRKRDAKWIAASHSFPLRTPDALGVNNRLPFKQGSVHLEKLLVINQK